MASIVAQTLKKYSNLSSLTKKKNLSSHFFLSDDDVGSLIRESGMRDSKLQSF